MKRRFVEFVRYLAEGGLIPSGAVELAPGDLEAFRHFSRAVRSRFVKDAAPVRSIEGPFAGQLETIQSSPFEPRSYALRADDSTKMSGWMTAAGVESEPPFSVVFSSKDECWVDMETGAPASAGYTIGMEKGVTLGLGPVTKGVTHSSVEEPGLPPDSEYAWRETTVEGEGLVLYPRDTLVLQRFRTSWTESPEEAGDGWTYTPDLVKARFELIPLLQGAQVVHPELASGALLKIAAPFLSGVPVRIAVQLLAVGGWDLMERFRAEGSPDRPTVVLQAAQEIVARELSPEEDEKAVLWAEASSITNTMEDHLRQFVYRRLTNLFGMRDWFEKASTVLAEKQRKQVSSLSGWQAMKEVFFLRNLVDLIRKNWEWFKVLSDRTTKQRQANKDEFDALFNIAGKFVDRRRFHAHAADVCRKDVNMLRVAADLIDAAITPYIEDPR